jgi:hypothetical protein
MPVSLSVGTVRTPEFSVVYQRYEIMLQVEKPLPFEKMVCMMAVTQDPFDSRHCSNNDPLLRAEWTVWDKDHIVDKGSSTTEADAKFSDKYIFKYLGGFTGEKEKKYVVEVTFTKDGTPLNIANPHLIVVQNRYR